MSLMQGNYGNVLIVETKTVKVIFYGAQNMKT